MENGAQENFRKAGDGPVLEITSSILRTFDSVESPWADARNTYFNPSRWQESIQT